MRRSCKACWAAVIATVTICFVLLAGMPIYSYAGSEDQDSDTETIEVDPTGMSLGYSAVLYNNMNGLPTSEANAIAETAEGFIWIGSYSGLIRYDGNTFENLSSSYGLSSVVSLFVDSEQRLWIGTNDSGVSVMEKGEFRTYNRVDGLTSVSVRAIVQSGSDIYLATTSGIGVIAEDMSLHMIEDDRISEAYIRSLKTGPDGTVYGITIGGDAFAIKDRAITDFITSDSLGIVDARVIHPDQDNPGYVFIGSTSSEISYGRIASGSYTEERVYDCEQISVINALDYHDGDLWVCADDGFGYFDDGKFIKISNVPMNTSIVDMMVDYLGDIWCVSSSQGVMKIVPNQFTDIFAKYGLEPEVVYTTCYQDGNLYIGTKTGGLIVISDGEIIDSVPLDSISGIEAGSEDMDLIELLRFSKIRSIIKDSTGTLWFSTFSDRGLVSYKDGNVQVFTVESGLPSNRVRTVYECKDGSMIACCTGGLALIKDGEVTKVYDDGSGIANLEILTACEMDNGDLVIGTDGGGIYVLNQNGATLISAKDGLTSDVIMRLKRSKYKDVVWIVTSNSLAYMDEDYQITTIRDFPYLNNFDVYENNNGELWVLSSNGIYVASVENLTGTSGLQTVFYGIDNGLPCIATSNSYSALTEDGDLYIAGSSGVALVNIDRTVDDASEFKACVPFVEADGEIIYPDSNGRFVIPETTQKLTVYGYVFNYSLMNPDVSYRLEGLEKKWITVSREDLMPISYTNLRGGTYTFQMQIDDSRGDGTQSISVVIVKTKSFYERTWVRIVAVLLILGALGVFVKMYIDQRTKKLTDKANEQKTLVREIVEAFAKIIDMKDKYTRGHSSRVALYTVMLAEEMGLDEDTIEKYHNIALLHDIGKIGIPEEVLNKPGKLNDDEYHTIQSHASLGYDALKDISIMPELSIGAGVHHERPDGKGYPRGLKGNDIPEVARIISVADCFDAMYSDRPYRKRMDFDKVVSIIRENSGTQLSSDVVDAFLRLVDKGILKETADKALEE